MNGDGFVIVCVKCVSMLTLLLRRVWLRVCSSRGVRLAGHLLQAREVGRAALQHQLAEEARLGQKLGRRVNWEKEKKRERREQRTMK